MRPFAQRDSGSKFDNAQPDPTPEEIAAIKAKEPTTWIEFSLPTKWEKEFEQMFSKWLEEKRKE
jgi:hypothetical protein